MTKILLNIPSMNALPEMLFANSAATGLLRFNTQVFNDGICDRGYYSRTPGKKKPTPCGLWPLRLILVADPCKCPGMVFFRMSRIAAKYAYPPHRKDHHLVSRFMRHLRRYGAWDAIRDQVQSILRRSRLHSVYIVYISWTVTESIPLHKSVTGQVSKLRKHPSHASRATNAALHVRTVVAFTWPTPSYPQLLQALGATRIPPSRKAPQDQGSSCATSSPLRAARTHHQLTASWHILVAHIKSSGAHYDLTVAYLAQGPGMLMRYTARRPTLPGDSKIMFPPL